MKRRCFTLVVSLSMLLIGASCSSGLVERDEFNGLASWYGEEMAGRTTANGEVFDPRALSAAHRTLPFGTLVEVTNQTNGQAVTVRINDRGPWIEKRIIDLSWGAAKELDMIEAGVVPVTLRIVAQADADEPPRPYVVSVEQPEKLIEIPRIPEDPPAVAFPLPDTIGDSAAYDRPQATQEEVVAGEDILVIEEGEGVETRKVVSSDGSTLIAAPVPEPEPKRVVRGEEGIRIEPSGEEQPAETRSETAPAEQGAEPYWVVQIGAFSVRENAERLASRASELEERIMMVEMRGTLRVQIGPFLSREEAIEARERLDEAGFDTLIMERQ